MVSGSGVGMPSTGVGSEESRLLLMKTTVWPLLACVTAAWNSREVLSLHKTKTKQKQIRLHPIHYKTIRAVPEIILGGVCGPQALFCPVGGRVFC